MIMCASASTLAAPPISFFISSMPLSGLMSRPPVSKHTPLPTSVTFGCARLAPAQVDQPRRARRRAADRMDQRKILRQQIVADDGSERWRHALARAARAASSSSAGPMSLDGVLMRSRASVTRFGDAR